MLRALVACGFSSQGWSEIPPVAQKLIGKLADVLPSYRLPTATAAHSRHFMPIGVLEKGREKTTLVFDTWADVGSGELVIHWPCELDDGEIKLFGQLSAALGYLGRSESWVEAKLSSEPSQNLEEFNAYPHREGMHPGRGYEQISLMAAVSSTDYQGWWFNQEEDALKPFPIPEGKKKPNQKTLKDREKAMAPYPPDILSCLTKDTIWWKAHGWSQPPGSQRVLYWRRSDALQVGTPVSPKAPESEPVTMMLLSLTTPSGNRSSLPPCSRVLPQSELIHRAIIGRLGKGREVYCPELIGKDEKNLLLRGSHQHAHTLPLDLDGDGHLDHILIYAEMKLGGTAQRAIREVRETWRKKGPELQVAVVGHGELDMLRQLPARLQGSIELLLGPPGGTRVWKSVTPFVPPRYLKSRGKNTVKGQISAELKSRNLPEPESVQVDPGLTRDLRHYVRLRSHGRAPQPPVDVGLGVHIVFPEPVSGPLLLGYASHFGLGLFAPADA